VGIVLPLVLLLAYELYARANQKIAEEYEPYLATKAARKAQAMLENEEESLEIKRQNRFGMQVIAGALMFVAVVLFGLSAFATSGGMFTAGIAVAVLLGAIIPWRAARRITVIGEKIEEVSQG